MARVEFSPDNYDPSKLCMLASVADDGTLCTLEASYLGVARLGGILGSQRRIKGFDNFFLITTLVIYHNDHLYHFDRYLVTL